MTDARPLLLAGSLACLLVPLAGSLLAQAAPEASSPGPVPLFPEPDHEGVVQLLIHATLEPFGFRLKGTRDPEKFEWPWIDGEKQLPWTLEVYRPGSPEPDQELPVGLTEPPPSGQSGISAVDFDGDGYRDLRLLDWWGATGNAGYEVFLFRPDEQRFEHSSLYSHAGGQPDGTGCVHWFSRGGHAGQIHSLGLSCPRDGQMAPRSEFRQDWNRELEVYTWRSRSWNADTGLLEEVAEGRLDGIQLDKRPEKAIETVWKRTWTRQPDGSFRCGEERWDGSQLQAVANPECGEAPLDEP